MNEWFSHERGIKQLKLAFDPPQFCSFCEEQIDLNNPSIRLLVSLGENELYCSRECYEDKHYHSSNTKAKEDE